MLHQDDPPRALALDLLPPASAPPPPNPAEALFFSSLPVAGSAAITVA